MVDSLPFNRYQDEVYGYLEHEGSDLYEWETKRRFLFQGCLMLPGLVFLILFGFEVILGGIITEPWPFPVRLIWLGMAFLIKANFQNYNILHYYYVYFYKFIFNL